MTVLYVEDEDDDVLFMKMAFKRLGIGMPLESVPNGKAAIDYLSKRPRPTLLLLDLNLPIVSGFEVLEWLRRQPALETLPVVIFSSSGRAEDRERAAALRADDYVLKPTSGSMFRDVLRDVQARWLPKGPGESE